MKPEWFPNWEGKVCAIIASGPSAKKANIEALRGRAVIIAIKENAHELCTWADVCYGCDAAWWTFRIGLRNFKGLKVAWSGANVRYPDVHSIDVDTSQDRIFPPERRQYRMVFDRPGVVGGGGNSGYQALNLAVQFGTKRILLIGFDMHDRGGTHWYGRNSWYNANNPDEVAFRRWINSFERAVPDLETQGVEVINTTPHTALNCFRRGTIEAALKGWGV